MKEYAVDPKTGALKLVEVGEFLQLPLRLGFAMTIHRSQGQTYDAATVDFAERGPFAEGQGYVAISRVRSLDGLTLTRKLRRADFKHSVRAAHFLASTTDTNGPTERHFELPQTLLRKQLMPSSTACARSCITTGSKSSKPRVILAAWPVRGDAEARSDIDRIPLIRH